MGQYSDIFSRGMKISIQEFAWVDPYLDYGCTTSDDTPIFNVSG